VRPKLLAIDLDGTLYPSDGHISERNLAALRRASEAGVLIAVATARAHQQAYAVGVRAGLDVATISSAGADVRLAGEKVVEQRPLPADFVPVVTAICDQMTGIVILSTPDHIYSRTVKPLPPGAPEWISNIALVAEAGLSNVLSVLLELPAGVSELVELGEWAKQLSVHSARSYGGSMLITITAGGVDKGSGLRSLCRATGINPADAVAIGDSEVDLPMFAVAGTSVAMGNASDEIKAAATRVTTPADADGVADAIERLLGE
jgi:hydroxymethylpyrimidine pyrophosphatase-like HAD family hydrolase